MRLRFSFLLVVSTLALSVPASSQDTGSSVAAYAQLGRANALFNESKFAEAKPLYEAFVKVNPTMGSQFRNLAACEHNLKQFDAAREHYLRAYALGFMPTSMLVQIACGYALQGKKAEALQYLERALKEKLEDPLEVSEDPDLATLKDDPQFRKLFGLRPSGQFSRDEAWRYDLQYLASEIKRKHYSPYLKTTEARIDAMAKAIHDDIPKLADHQIIFRMHGILASLGDGHSSLVGPGTHMFGNNALMAKTLPIRFRSFADGIFVVSASPSHKDLLGKKLTAINEQSVDQLAAKLRPHISTDNETWPWTRLPDFLANPQILHAAGLVGNVDTVKVTVEGSTVDLKTVPGTEIASFASFEATGPKPLSQQKPNENYWFDWNPTTGMMFVQYNAGRENGVEELAHFWMRMFQKIEDNDVKAMVIDLRNNHGGSGELHKALYLGLVKSKVNQRGKLFTLIGPETFSAALICAVDLELHTNTIFVGEPTGGKPNSVGETGRIVLPFSGAMGSISTRFHQASYSQDARPTVPPRIYAPLTFAAYAAGRDPGMEAIEQYLKLPRG